MRQSPGKRYIKSISGRINLHCFEIFSYLHQFIQAVDYTVQSTNPLVLHWTADIPVDIGYSALQAKVIRP